MAEETVAREDVSPGEAPEQFGPYRLDALLGRGGMGEVFRAYDASKGREVALKRLPAPLVHDREYAYRFRREAQLAARLNEPHVIPVYDFGEIDGRLYLAMRLVQGTDLRAALDAGPLPTARAVEIVGQVASALDAAHADGLVHRDVKPSNVLLVGDPHGAEPGFAYLTDFGIASPVGEPDPGSDGQPVGSINYLAPEAMTGGSVDHRADVYALGCVLYEALTARRAFEADDVVTTLHALLSRPAPRPSAVRPDLPIALDEVVARALAKDPGQRWASAGALAAAARAAVTGAAPPATDRPTTDRPATDPPATRSPRVRGAGARAAEPATDRLPGHRGADGARPVAEPDPVEETVPPADGGVRAGSRTWTPEPPRPVRLRLNPRWAYLPGPLTHHDPLPFLGNQAGVDTIREHILHSPGGALLVSGFNGAGKTTVVTRALAELRARLWATGPEPVPLVEVLVTVARPTTPDELLVTLIRTLCEALRGAGVLDRIPAGVREALEIAYRRTSLTLRAMHSEGTERTYGLSGDGLPLTPTFGRTRTRASEREEAYREYSFADAEHDFRRIVAALSPRRWPEPPRPRTLIQRLSGIPAPPPPWRGRTVVVIDELDKLTAEPGGMARLETLLRALKNVFTTTDLHFVFVAGADVLEMTRTAAMRGSSVWTGVFGLVPYLPCLRLGSAGKLVGAVLAERPPGRAMADLCDYLEYRSRGLPRLMLNAVNELVVRHGDVPWIVLDEPTAARVAFYAEVQRRLGPLWARRQGPRSHPIDVDRRRIAVHLVAEWALARGHGTFSAADFAADTSESRPDPGLVSDATAAQLLADLASERVGVLERWEATAPSRTVIDDAAPDGTVDDVLHDGAGRATERVYRIEASLLAALSATHREVADHGELGHGRYQLLDELHRGALGRTYRALDENTGREVAVKLFDLPGLQDDPVARRRFRREVDLATRLSHPRLATTLDVLDEADGSLALVTEFVEGTSLEDLLRTRPRSGPLAVAVGHGLAELLEYLDERGVARLDLKPSNVVLGTDGRPVLLELGMARAVQRDAGEAVTRTGALVGTPRYLAPEQITGGTVDVRSDLFALGLILHEIVGGEPVRGGTELVPMLMAALHERPRTDHLPCSPALRAVIGGLLDLDPARRLGPPAAVCARLAATPEAWQGLANR